MLSSAKHKFAALAVVALTAATLTAAAAPAQATAPGGTYVSLGDSLAFGYQKNLVLAGDFNPAHYVGFAEDYAAMKDLPLANFGCPGETSTTLINGTCPWVSSHLPLHMPYGGATQLQAAVAYLSAHPDTSLISVEIGSNDLLATIYYCKATDPANLMTCLQTHLPATLATLAANYTQILGAVHAAAPNARIVVFGLYNPLALSLPGSDMLLTDYVNPTISRIAMGFAQATGAKVTVADAFSRMNGTAGSPSEQAFVCSRTWMCTSLADIHATDLGYQQMAVALLQSLK